MVSEQAEELPVGETGEILQEALDEFMSVLTSASQLSMFEEQTVETDEKSSVPALTAEVYAACGETSDAEEESNSDAESVDFQKLVSKLSEISSPEDLATLVGALRLTKEAPVLPAIASKEHTGSTTPKTEECNLKKLLQFHEVKARLAANTELHADALAREELARETSEPVRQHLNTAAGQTPGSIDLREAYDRNGLDTLDSCDYDPPVFPEVDVIEPAARRSVPDLVSDSESDHSQVSAEDHADLFETLRESLISYRAAEKELLRRRNQYRDIQNEAAARQRQDLKGKEVRKLLPVKEKEVHSHATQSKKGKEVSQTSHRIPEPANSKLIHTGLSLHNLTHSSDAVTLAMARETDGLWIIPASGGQPVTGDDIRKRDVENRPACQVCDQMKMKMASSRQAHPVHQAAAYAVDVHPLDGVREKYGPAFGPDRSHHFMSKMVANGNLSSAKPVVARQSRRGRRSKPVRTCPGQVEQLLSELAGLLKPAASRKDGSSRRRHLSH